MKMENLGAAKAQNVSGTVDHKQDMTSLTETFFNISSKLLDSCL